VSLTRLRPSPAIVISLLALFISLGGVSYGVATGYIDGREIKNNSVRSRDIRNNDILTKDIRDNAVRGVDIRNSTILSRDVALAALTGEDIKESTLAEVPSAARARSAAAVDSLRAIAQTTVQVNGTPATLLRLGPFTVIGRRRAAPRSRAGSG
jgi:hypothetical protein